MPSTRSPRPAPIACPTRAVHARVRERARVCRGLVLSERRWRRARVGWEVLAEQSVGVLVAAALPGTLGIAEVDLHAGFDGELDVFGHLFALVPGDRSAQLRGQRQDPFGHRGADCGCAVTVGEFEQDHVALCRSTSVPIEVIFFRKIRSPSQWPGTARSATSAGRSEIITMSRCRGSGLGRPRPWCRPSLGASPDRSASTQLFAERAAALHEQRLIGGLVRHVHLRVVRILLSHTPRSVAATTVPRASARQCCGAADIGRAWLAWVATSDVAHPDRPATPYTSSGRRSRAPPERSSTAIGSTRRQWPGSTAPRPAHEKSLRARPATTEAHTALEGAISRRLLTRACNHEPEQIARPGALMRVLRRIWRTDQKTQKDVPAGSDRPPGTRRKVI
jgi:hypothetical protein